MGSVAGNAQSHRRCAEVTVPPSSLRTSTFSRCFFLSFLVRKEGRRRRRRRRRKGGLSIAISSADVLTEAGQLSLTFDNWNKGHYIQCTVTPLKGRFLFRPSKSRGWCGGGRANSLVFHLKASTNCFFFVFFFFLLLFFFFFFSFCLLLSKTTFRWLADCNMLAILFRSYLACSLAIIRQASKGMFNVS